MGAGWKPGKRTYLFAVLALLGGGVPAAADVISFGGLITQSTSDGTGPAVNNPSLNNILDGEQYTVTVNFTGSVTVPGTYALSSASISFSVPGAPASETSFGPFQCAAQSTLACFTVSTAGSFYDISLLGCLTTGSGCQSGNELDANFMIPETGLNSQNVAAQGIFALTPLDLLEDDGTTDIQASVTTYSASSVPEPSSVVLLLALLAWIVPRLRLTRTPH